MAALPYMRMYWADYDADTSHLTAMQHGIYLLLIKNYWQRGAPLPDDEIKLARIAKVSLKDWRHNEAVIREFFTKQENLLHHSRIALELSRVEVKSLNNKRPGNANAKRTQRDRDANETRSPIYTEADTEKGKKDAPSGAYAFVGKIVRLKPEQFSKWQKSFRDLDLTARLQQRDDWLANEADERTKKNWFIPTSNWLANLQSQAANEARQPSWDQMP